ncbi:MAG TPA: hypothetical protein VMK31_05310 [Sphingomicrobium sp.]|nr:hypothetical protein [Sphingomicrobium sp.]
MIKKLLIGAGMAWLARKFMGGNDRTSRNHDRQGGGFFGMGRSRR